MATASYAQDVAATPVGRMSAWEAAKAYAFSAILADVSDNLGTPAAELLGQRVDEYIASKVTLKGGGHPDARALPFRSEAHFPRPQGCNPLLHVC